MAAVVHILAGSLTYVWERDWKPTLDETVEFVGGNGPFFAGKEATVQELGLTPGKKYKFEIVVKSFGEDPVLIFPLGVKTVHSTPAPTYVFVHPSDAFQTIPISDEYIDVGGARDYVNFGIVKPFAIPTRFITRKGFFISEVLATEYKPPE